MKAWAEVCVCVCVCVCVLGCACADLQINERRSGQVDAVPTMTQSAADAFGVNPAQLSPALPTHARSPEQLRRRDARRTARRARSVTPRREGALSNSREGALSKRPTHSAASLALSRY